MQRCELDSLYSLSSLARSSSFGLGRLTASNTSASLGGHSLRTFGASPSAAQLVSSVPPSASVYTNLSFVDGDGEGSGGSADSENENGAGGEAGAGLELEPDEDVLWHTNSAQALLPQRAGRGSGFDEYRVNQSSGRSGNERPNGHRAGDGPVARNGHYSTGGTRVSRERTRTVASESEQHLLEYSTSDTGDTGQNEGPTSSSSRLATGARHEHRHSATIRHAVRCRMDREREMEEAAVISVPFGLFDVVRTRDAS